MEEVQGKLLEFGEDSQGRAFAPLDWQVAVSLSQHMFTF
jgi:hypothetical protein